MTSVTRNVFADGSQAIMDESPLDSLGLSVRALRALQRNGCNTVGDVLRLDVNAQIPGLGRKSLTDVLSKLEEAGVPHPAAPRPSEIMLLERNLERIQERLDIVVGAVTKEIRMAKARIRRLQSAKLLG
jgi:hypothetical protein